MSRHRSRCRFRFSFSAGDRTDLLAALSRGALLGLLLLTSCSRHDPVPVDFATDPRILRGRYEGVIDTRYATTQLALSADAQTLAMGGGDGIARVQLWDTQTQTVTKTLGRLGADDFAPDVAITADGSRVASSVGGSTQIWEVATGAVQTLARGGQLALTADGTYLAIGSYEAEVVLLEVASGREQVLTTPGDTLEPPIFSGDGARLAVLSYGVATEVGGASRFSVRVWQVASGAEVLALEGAVTDTGSGYVYPLMAFSADGRSLAFLEGNRVRVHDVEKNQLITTLPLPDVPSGIALSPDGSRLAVGGYWTGGVSSVKIFEVASGTLHHELEHGSSAAWSLDGKSMLMLARTAAADDVLDGDYSGSGDLPIPVLVRTEDYSRVGTYVNGELYRAVLEATPEYLDGRTYGVSGTLQLGEDAPIPFEGMVDGKESQRYLAPQHSLPEPAAFVLKLRDHPWTLYASQYDDFSENPTWQGYVEDSNRPNPHTFVPSQLELRRAEGP